MTHAQKSISADSILYRVRHFEARKLREARQPADLVAEQESAIRADITTAIIEVMTCTSIEDSECIEIDHEGGKLYWQACKPLIHLNHRVDRCPYVSSANLDGRPYICLRNR